MKYLSELYFFIIILYFFGYSNQEEIDDYKKNGQGYQCKEKLEEYRKKFSSVKSFILTDENINNYLNENKFTLVYIHSACTKESHDFIPIIKYVSEYLDKIKEPDSPKLATLEITDDEHNWNNQYKYYNQYYPIIILKIKGKKYFYPYNGYYSAQSIITFATKFSSNWIIQINNTNILEQFLSPKLTYLSIITFSNKNTKIFKQFSEGLSYILFGNCTGEKVCEEKFDKNIYRYSDFALIKMTHIDSDFEESPDNKKLLEDNKKPEIIPYNYTNFQKFKEFLYLNAMPKIFNFTGFNKDLLAASLVTSIIYVRGKEEKKSNKEISKILRKAINLDNSKILIGGILDPINNENEKSLMNTFRLEIDDYSVYGNVIIQTFNNQEQILYRINIHQVHKDKGITEENLLNFVKDFNKNKLKPELKSENRPTVHPKDNLRMIVARTFEEEITYNDKVAIVLCLLTMNLTNLKEYENLIDVLTMKMDAFNDTLIFAYIDVGLNYMEDLPKYDSAKTPYYRYYYKNKSEGYDDFKGNYSSIEEIEEWVAVNYGKENGEGFDDLVRKYIENVNEQMREEEKEKKRKEAEFERDVLAGNVSSFEMILGAGDSQPINITEIKIKRILEKRVEAERRKKKEEELKNKTKEYYDKMNQEEQNKKETDL